MPTFNVYVTTPKDQIPSGFLLDASKFIAAQLGKPESYVCVRVIPDQLMCFGGSTEPCGSLELMSIGALGEKNKEHAKAIGEFMQAKLHIPNNRFYVTFTDIERLNCAYGGKTFAG